MGLIEDARKLAPNLTTGTPSVYTGCSTDCESRFREHLAGTGCRTTRLDPR
jgi:predicted GIY-YIG superfamily endonuclease